MNFSSSRSMRAAPRKTGEIGPNLTRMPPSTRFGAGSPLDHGSGNAIRDLADAAERREHLRRGAGDSETLFETVCRHEGRGDLRGRRGNARRHGLRRRRAGRQAGSDPRPDRSQSAPGISDDRGDPPLASGGDDASDRLDDPDIAGAAAEIAAEAQPDAPLVGLPKAKNQIASGDQHSGRAESALQRVLPVEGGAQLDRDLVVIEALDGCDVGPAAGAGEGDARADRLAVDKKGAGPANPMLASQMRAREVEISRAGSRRGAGEARFPPRPQGR